MIVTGFADYVEYCPYCGNAIVLYDDRRTHEVSGYEYKCLTFDKVFFVIEGEEDDDDSEDED